MSNIYDTFDLEEKDEDVYLVTSGSDSESSSPIKNVTTVAAPIPPTPITAPSFPMTVEDIKTIKDQNKNWFSITIKEYSNLLNIIEESQFFKECECKDKATKQNIILDTILNTVEPFIFIPCLFSEYQSYCSFYVSNCDAALKKLNYHDNVCISREIPDLKFSLQILATSPYQRNLSVSYLLQKGLKRRFTTENNTLNLSNFGNDISFKNKLYFPLWYIGNQKMISAEIDDAIPSTVIENLDFTHNLIRDFTGFNMNVFGSLNSLNISYNKIDNLEDLIPFSGVYVKSFNLEFNPICYNYVQKERYIKAVKLIFPTLSCLDGNDVSPNALPKVIKNYSVDKRSTPIIGKFLEVFYSLFDSEDRSLMMDMYSKQAMFSLNCHSSDVTFYKRARNIIDTNTLNIFVGPRSIIGCLCWIPQTEHDPLSFQVDVIHYSDSYIIFNITGLFKIPSEYMLENEPVFEFMRSFVLHPSENEYKISNEIFGIKSITKPPADSFRLVSKISSKLTLTPTETLSDTTKKSLVDIFVNLTQLSVAEAYECLIIRQWNFQSAIKHALTILKNKP